MFYFQKFRSVIAFGGALFAIFWLPKDVEDWNVAVQPWKRWVSVLDESVLLWAFSLSAFTYILWMKFGPNRVKRALSSLSKLEKVRNCPSQFENRLTALEETFADVTQSVLGLKDFGLNKGINWTDPWTRGVKQKIRNADGIYSELVAIYRNTLGISKNLQRLDDDFDYSLNTYEMKCSENLPEDYMKSEFRHFVRTYHCSQRGLRDASDEIFQEIQRLSKIIHDIN